MALFGPGLVGQNGHKSGEGGSYCERGIFNIAPPGVDDAGGSGFRAECIVGQPLRKWIIFPVDIYIMNIGCEMSQLTLTVNDAASATIIPGCSTAVLNESLELYGW